MQSNQCCRQPIPTQIPLPYLQHVDALRIFFKKTRTDGCCRKKINRIKRNNDLYGLDFDSGMHVQYLQRDLVLDRFFWASPIRNIHAKEIHNRNIAYSFPPPYFVMIKLYSFQGSQAAPERQQVLSQASKVKIPFRCGCFCVDTELTCHLNTHISLRFTAEVNNALPFNCNH